MTKREIASLTIKLMGVFILLKSIAYMPAVFSGIFSAVRSHDGAGFLQTIFVMMMFSLAVAIPVAWSLLIIFFSDKAATWLIKEDGYIQTSSSINKDDVMVIAISCIGLYFTVAALPQIIGALMFNVPAMLRRMDGWFTGPSGSMNLLRQLVIPAVQIALGIWLFVGSRGIVKLWKKVRS